MVEPTLLTVREATFGLLREFGLNCVFGNPGSTELPMFRDFPPDFRYMLGLQESVVVGMADGYAQARGSAALVNLHSAIGVGHALGAIFTAFRNQTPLVVGLGDGENFLASSIAAFLNETRIVIHPADGQVIEITPGGVRVLVDGERRRRDNS